MQSALPKADRTVFALSKCGTGFKAPLLVLRSASWHKQMAQAKLALRIHDHNLRKDHQFGNMTGRNPKPVIWFLKEVNDQLTDQMPLLPEKLTPLQMFSRNHVESRMTHPPKEFQLESLGLDFMKLKNRVTVEQQNFLNAVASGDIQDAMAVTDTVDEFDDDPDLIAALAGFDLAAVEAGHATAPPESVGTPSTPIPKKRRMDTKQCWGYRLEQKGRGSRISFPSETTHG